MEHQAYGDLISYSASWLLLGRRRLLSVAACTSHVLWLTRAPHAQECRGRAGYVSRSHRYGTTCALLHVYINCWHGSVVVTNIAVTSSYGRGSAVR